MSPTQRSLELLRSMGYVAEVVERWVPQARVRLDFCGCIDILAVHSEHGFLGVQATSASNVSARVKKAEVEPRLDVFLAAGGKFEVWGWGKKGAKGERKLWKVRRVEIPPPS